MKEDIFMVVEMVMVAKLWWEAVVKLKTHKIGHNLVDEAQAVPMLLVMIRWWK